MDTTVYILSEKNTGSYYIPPCKRSINILEKDFFCCLEMEKYINFPDRGLRQSRSWAVTTNRAKLLFISHTKLITQYNHLFPRAVHTHTETQLASWSNSWETNPKQGLPCFIPYSLSVYSKHCLLTCGLSRATHFWCPCVLVALYRFGKAGVLNLSLHVNSTGSLVSGAHQFFRAFHMLLLSTSFSFPRPAVFW